MAARARARWRLELDELLELGRGRLELPELDELLELGRGRLELPELDELLELGRGRLELPRLPWATDLHRAALGGSGGRLELELELDELLERLELRELGRGRPVTWEATHDRLAGEPPGTSEDVTDLGAPEAGGADPSVGLPVGQARDWRFPPDAQCRGVHVQEFADGHRSAHLDRVHPACSVVDHLRYDAPALWVALAVTVGGVVGSLAGAPWVGAACGLGAGVMMLATRGQEPTR